MKIFLLSLGCDKNLVDSERMLGLLAADGWEITDDETAAEIIIVNSCCFIDAAKEESIAEILRLARLKEEGRCRVLILTGCLAQRYRDEIAAELPEVDAIVGVASIEKIAGVVRETLEKKGAAPAEAFDPIAGPLKPVRERMLTTGGHYAYLKIAEGCDKHCTYCVIPQLRGPYRSYPMASLLEEAERLVQGGVKELILVAQETTRYGLDTAGRRCLPELLRGLSAIGGLEWIRVLYCYPEEIDAELIAELRDNEKVCKYLDIPIQHASDDVLRRMGRRISRLELETLIGTLRREIPGICLRTTLISGFPGETEEDHRILKDFVQRMRFDRLGVFPYSREEGTPAYRMADQIPQEEKERRRDELMTIQQEISEERAAAFAGQTLDCLVEGSIPEEEVYVGRTYRDAPDVDGYLFFRADRTLMTGDLVPVWVEKALEYDMIGELCDEPAE